MNASVNLKDKLDGKELDLSLDNLSVVPVKEMAALTQATHVDLSCNLLTSLPDGFCQLTHLVKLDLSKNKLVQLPKNFGNLRKLQRLDLLGNKLVTLPVSIGSLKSLTWLDLKGNQLDERLSSVAGNCLNEAECKACAKKMVVFMKEIQSEKEKKLQKKLEEERAAEALRKQDLDKVRDLRKKQKASEKENRRKEWKLKEKTKVKEFSEKDTDNHKNGTAQDIKHKECLKKNGLSRCGACISFLVLLLAVALGLFLAFNPHLIELGRQKWQNYFRMS